MELYQSELKDAQARLRKAGLDDCRFAFVMAYLPPESDDGAMFTVRYEIKVTSLDNARTKIFVGGIGLHWVDAFQAALEDGKFG